jgi:hypothetical protein
VIEAVVLAVTADAVAVNVDEVEPAAIVKDAGADKICVEDDSVTVAPVEGAAAVSATVQVEVPGVVIVAGVQTKDERAAGLGLSVSEADLVTPPRAPETVTGVLAATADAVAVKVADVPPDATVTDDGTLRAGAEEESVTAAPPEPAAPDSVIVQVEVAGVRSAVGVQPMALTVTGAEGVATVMDVPEAVVGIPAPGSSALTPRVSVIGTEAAAVDAIFIATFATTPFAIVLVLMPLRTQMADVAVVLH